MSNIKTSVTSFVYSLNDTLMRHDFGQFNIKMNIVNFIYLKKAPDGINTRALGSGYCLISTSRCNNVTDKHTSIEENAKLRFI
jgi:hypothetical protein